MVDIIAELEEEAIENWRVSMVAGGLYLLDWTLFKWKTMANQKINFFFVLT